MLCVEWGIASYPGPAHQEPGYEAKWGSTNTSWQIDVHHEFDIYLLDDPLSAVDAGVARHLFEK